MRAGVPVTVFEAGADLSTESRASTFHPPTLDMLDALGAAQPLIAQGLVAPSFQYRTKKDGLVAQFDFGAIADATSHPYRVQAEQSKLTRILLDQLRGKPGFEIAFDSRVPGRDAGSRPRVDGRDRARRRSANPYRPLADRRRRRRQQRAAFARRRVRGLHLAGPAAGGVDAVRFHSVIPGLTAVNYVADPERWHFLLQIPGLWRVMFLIKEDVSDEQIADAASSRSR